MRVLYVLFMTSGCFPNSPYSILLVIADSLQEYDRKFYALIKTLARFDAGKSAIFE